MQPLCVSNLFDVLVPEQSMTVTFAVAKFSEDATDIEQHITIVPNPRAKRRGSMADYAFPELHSKNRKTNKEPENLLILTRTKTDRNGRRHSVAVPLIPPPDGERFEGGYHVERNPITGGARLVPPSGKHSTFLPPFVQCTISRNKKNWVPNYKSLLGDRVENVFSCFKDTNKSRSRSSSERRGNKSGSNRPLTISETATPQQQRPRTAGAAVDRPKSKSVRAPSKTRADSQKNVLQCKYRFQETSCYYIYLIISACSCVCVFLLSFSL